jgi:hypothetical protein
MKIKITWFDGAIEIKENLNEKQIKVLENHKNDGTIKSIEYIKEEK